MFRLGGWAHAGWCHLSAAAALARPPGKRAANELLATDVELDVRSMRLRVYAWDPIQSRLGVCMQWGAHACVGSLPQGDLVCWDGGCLGGFFFFFSRAITLKSCTINRKEAIGNDSREAKRPKAWYKGGSE